ncbi:DEAD/DEAH box helicase [Sulfuracidifex tepidarius]|uniref:ATP-dependent DNA helicase Hel308 n=1 Tax=Sulfuracidifex tepidarius TaxID=1294262 RepID=A0A510DWT7_9CREN|nr:DEAD/DEAH box helicase [Sulfuracidifex tepidarius]BBG24691.1 ATP-dependent DNA helicase Hel308 [Sulfuracidifex tepidarius]BBG27479.1 ATP-dependent DNA helicase Hel308 [Sulfuracidifex tepidarius]
MEQLDDFLSDVSKALASFSAKIVHVRTETSMDPDLGPPVISLEISQKLKDALIQEGIQRLYKFQAEAIERIMKGENLMIVSGTGTGKTEAFLIPAVERAMSGEKVVLVYPAKALARDQVKRIRRITDKCDVTVGIFDGDTSEKERRELSDSPPDLLVTNPDMVHRGLPLSDRFSSLIRESSMFIFDEVHVYEGVMGAHLRWISERLAFDRKPQIVASSATIGGTDFLFKELFGLSSGSLLRGTLRRKGVAIHALIDSNGSSRWILSAFLGAYLARKGLKSIIFVDSQQMAEVTAKITERFHVKFEVHRAGTDKEYRIRVEEMLREGKIDGVVATPTLELGIDIGSIDCVIMSADPPSFTKYVQRAGRAGRRNKVAFVFTILGDSPIESYYLRNPNEFFQRELLPIPFDPTNLEVAKMHLLGMLLERKVLSEERLPDIWKRALPELECEGYLKRNNGFIFPTHLTKTKFLESSLRSSGKIIEAFDGKRKVGERELPVALYEFYPGGYYLASKRSYRVKILDLDKMRAELEESKITDFYTKPIYTVDIKEFKEINRKKVLNMDVKYGEMEIQEIVTGYSMYSMSGSSRDKPKREVFYDEPISFSYKTKGVYIKHPVMEWMKNVEESIKAFHATEHVLIASARVVAGASQTDLSGVSYPSGDVAIYDSTIGGNGISALLYDRLESAYEISKEITGNCTCEDGCPKCVYSPYCGNNNRMLSRKLSYRLIKGLLEDEGKEIYSNRWGEPVV